MFKLTISAVLIALCFAERDNGASRLLLQTGTVTPPTTVTPPGTNPPPVQPQPVQAPPTAPYNPYAQQQPQQTYNPYGSYNSLPGGVNMNNPYIAMYCNPYSSNYDLQDCYQYAYMYGMYNNQQAVPGQQGGAQQPGYNQQAAYMNNPYCNPYSGNYDAQDCLRSTNPYAAMYL